MKSLNNSGLRAPWSNINTERPPVPHNTSSRKNNT